MTTQSSPVVASMELRLRYIRRRKDEGLAGGTIANGLGFSRNHWSAIENGRTLLAVEKFDELVGLLKFSDRDIEELRELDKVSRQQGWWTKAVTGEGTEVLAELCGLEAGAKSIRTYESMAIPGLLQTRDYATAIVGRHPLIGRLDLNRLVDVREMRQQRLVGPSPLALTAIVTEAALRHQVADSAVQIAQLQKVRDEMESNDNVEVRILPFEQHPGVMALASTVVLFKFDSAYLPTIVWQEALAATGPIDDARTAEMLELAWGDLYINALPQPESIALIDELVGKIKAR